MKKLLKQTLAWLNDKSVSVFCRLHFRKQAKRYCNKNNIPDINRKYENEIKNYWGKYERKVSTVFHRWYTGSNGIEDVRYIPEDFFFDKIERFYNDIALEPAYSDKGLYRRLFPDVKQPETIIVNMNGVFYDENYHVLKVDEAINKVIVETRYVIKPTRDSGGGKNVTFISDTFNNKKKIVELFQAFKKDFIIQRPLVQNKKLAEIHENSINTIRVMSFLKNGDVSIISTVLRIGVGNSCVDNEFAGGINCGVDKNGQLSHIAFDGSGKRYDRHPQGYEFENRKVPSFDKVIQLVKEQHLKLPYFGLISWDFTVDEAGNPVMIELNLRWCALNFHQLHHGPLFGDKTEEILNTVCNGKEKNA